MSGFLITYVALEHNQEPENLIKLFAAFAFADEKSLGFDPPIQPVTGDPGQFDITVQPDNDKKNSKKFRTVRVIFSYRREYLRGRGTRVFEAVELDVNGEPNGSHVVLKDIWADTDCMREGKIVESLYEAADSKDKQLIQKYFLTTTAHGDVWTEANVVDDTANGLMRGLNISLDHDSSSVFKLEYEFLYSCQKYKHMTHYRIVFAEICKPIDLISSLSDVMSVLSEATRGAFQ